MEGFSMKKSQKGFTLVELVVVIAIIGVLAAILVPSMLNYVKKSRLKTANSNAKTAYNAAAEYIADQETKGIGRATALKDFDTKLVEAKSASKDGDVVVADVLVENGDEAGCFIVFSQTLNKKSSFVVQWCKSTSDEMLGQYPDAISWDKWKSKKPGASSAGTYVAP
jgi:type IV pilus assembly protein PilA